MQSILAYQHDQMMNAIGSYKAEIADKLKNGETEEKIATGAKSFTQKEWNKLIEHVDKDIEEIKEEQKIRFEKQDEERQAKELYEKMVTENQYRGQNLEARMSGEDSKVPYSYLAKNGVIEYNGVTFVCDEEKRAICLGDMSKKEKVLTIPLENGGSLKVNRDNLGELGKAMEMFSSEDKKRILWAIATDNKSKQMEEELEEDENSIGDSAEEAIL